VKLLRPLLVCLVLGAPALAQDTTADLAAQAATRLREAVTALQGADGAKDRVAALTQTIGAYELGLSVFRESLRAAAIREKEVTDRLDAKRERVARVLAAMTAVESASDALLFLHPDGPEAAVRSGLVLSSVAPALQAEAEALRADLTEIAALRALQEEAASVLQAGLVAAQDARTALSLAIQERTDLPRRFLEDPEELQALLASADTLDAFAIGLSGMESDIGPPLGDFAGAKGSLPMPVLGRMLRRPGEADAAGISRPGFLVATAPAALVTNPWPATVRYRGPLLDYGNVMILEPARGYLMVIAGLGTVYGSTGDVLDAGAPIGLMPERAGAAAQTGGAERTETLYVELRQDGETLDPLGWFAQTGQ
jgi:septal ring factor EnvC (AmiA/AmiB activator)